MASGATKLERAPQMAWQTVDGELVLLNIDGKELMGVNAVGARVWGLCEGELSLDEIAAKVAEEFRIGIEVARADVGRFVDELLAAGALVER